MNWVRQEKRLAIFARDGFACVFCGHAVERGARLSCDHVVPDVMGGTNDADNLVTVCFSCNSARQAKTVRAFARRFHNPAAIVRRIERTRVRPIDVPAAKALIARRGSTAKVLRAMGGGNGR